MDAVILISIHPEHFQNIASGKKVFEYRKVMPAQNVSYLVIYCTMPIKKIVAIAEVVESLIDTPSKIWAVTAHGAGISKEFYFEYFSGKRKAGSFMLGNVYKLLNPIDLSCLTSCINPPQSFCYLNSNDMKHVFGEIPKQFFLKTYDDCVLPICE